MLVSLNASNLGGNLEIYDTWIGSQVGVSFSIHLPKGKYMFSFSVSTTSSLCSISMSNAEVIEGSVINRVTPTYSTVIQTKSYIVNASEEIDCNIVIGGNGLPSGAYAIVAYKI